MYALATPSLLLQIPARTARVGVIGLGHVGLPLAVEFARADFSTIGIDIDAQHVRSVNEGRMSIADVPPAEVRRVRRQRKLWATPDFDVVADLDVVIICVPTGLHQTRTPELATVIAAVESVAHRLRPGMLVIIESALPPGAMQEVILPRLEQTGLHAGIDFFLACALTRIDPANRAFSLRNIPKVVGGITPQCTELTAALYASVTTTVVPVTCARTAEMVKLLEATFRSVNIGLVNELALMCERLSIDVWEVIGAAATKPFGFMPFWPGPGIGGDCTAIDAWPSWQAKAIGFRPRLMDLAGEVNAAMPQHVVSLVAEALNAMQLPINGARILIAGVAYKRDVANTAAAPALDVMTLLHRQGAVLSYLDPHVPRLAGSSCGSAVDLVSVDSSVVAPHSFDCVVLLTDHGLFDSALVGQLGRTIVDTRNLFAPAPHILKLGDARRRPEREVLKSAPRVTSLVPGPAVLSDEVV